MKVLSATFDMNVQRITNLGTPSLNADAATKLYVDGKGGVTSVSVTSPIVNTGSSTAPNIGLDDSVDLGLLASQSIRVTDASNSTMNALILSHNVSITPTVNLGTAILFQGETDTNVDQSMAQIVASWSVVVNASRSAYIDLRTVLNGVMGTAMRLHASNGCSLNNTTDPGAGYFNVPTAGGYKINNVDIFPLTTARGGVPSGGAAGQYLKKNSATNYDYSWDQHSFGQSSAAVNTAGTTNTGGVMAGMGSGVTITPSTTGRILVILSGYFTSAVANAFAAVVALKYGTGTAPAHGAAITGTSIGNAQAWGTSSTAGALVPFTCQAIVTGLAIGTTYWLDAAYGSSSVSSTAKLNTAIICAIEF